MTSGHFFFAKLGIHSNQTHIKPYNNGRIIKQAYDTTKYQYNCESLVQSLVILEKCTKHCQNMTSGQIFVINLVYILVIRITTKYVNFITFQEKKLDPFVSAPPYQRAIISLSLNKVRWKMVGRQAEGEEVAAALFEDLFGGIEIFVFACMFHGHGTGHRMGGRMVISERLLNVSLELHTSSIVKPLTCLK